MTEKTVAAGDQDFLAPAARLHGAGTAGLAELTDLEHADRVGARQHAVDGFLLGGNEREGEGRFFRRWVRFRCHKLSLLPPPLWEGGAENSVLVATPLPVPPPQGGREPWGWSRARSQPQTR